MQDLRSNRHNVPDLDNFGFRPLTNPRNFPQLEHRHHQSSQSSRPKSSSSSSSSTPAPTGAGAGATAAVATVPKHSAVSQDNNEFYRDALKVHNELRRKHGVEPLQLNNELCKLAQQWGM